MIRYRIFLLLLYTSLHLITAEDVPRIAENNISYSKAPDKIILERSESYSEGKTTNPFESESKDYKSKSDLAASASEADDLATAASEHISGRILQHSSNRFKKNARNCYECNSEPWIPVVGRSLHFPPASSHTNSLEENSNHHHHSNEPYFKEKDPINKQYSLYHPPIDQYGAPQANFDYPRTGEVVDFMLPPPYQSQNLLGNLDGLHSTPVSNYGPPKQSYRPPQTQYGSPKPVYGPPLQNNQNIFNLGPPPLQQSSPSSLYRPYLNSKAPSFNYGPPSINYVPPFSTLNNHGHLSLPPSTYGAPTLPSNSYGPPGGRYVHPTTHLRPVSQNFQPPVPVLGVQSLPLENNNPPPPVPSDSYGKPLVPSDSYGAPVIPNHQQYVEPITLGSDDSGEYGISFNPQNYFSDFESKHNEEIKASLYQKGLTDVQVVPSVRIADYTASIEHPIDVIQSPILDLNVKDQKALQGLSNEYGLEPSQHVNEQPKASNTYNELNGYESGNKLSENPIIVDDTYTSASNINTTYTLRENSTTAKRDNDKFLSSNVYKNQNDKLKEADLTTNLIQRLILEHNLIKDPHTQIVGIQKSVIDPKKVKTQLNVIQPSIDYSSWSPSNPSSISTMILPPKQSTNTWLSPGNDSFVTPKTLKNLQIIVPYLKAPENNNLNWNQNFNHKSTGLYNKEYTTLAPVFVPPPLSTESSNLWTKLVEDIRTVESHREKSQGFTPSSTTEVYNIKEFLANQNNRATSNLPYNGLSLQKNIDNWTHQSYANRMKFGDKLSTKLLHIKNIPEEYFTSTSSYEDQPFASEIKGTFRDHQDNIASSSNNKEYISEEIKDNLISPEDATTLGPSTERIIATTTPTSITYFIKKPKPSWEHDKVTFSNSTHEKVYVVTPQSYTHFSTSTPATAYSMGPKIQNGKVNNVATMTRISVRVEAPSEKEKGRGLKPVKVVYSEWPHLINNLATTTTSRPTTRHPLFGLMADLSAYTPPPNSKVETIGGHSKVASIVTPPIKKYSSTSPAPSTNSKGTVKISSASS